VTHSPRGDGGAGGGGGGGATAAAAAAGHHGRSGGSGGGRGGAPDARHCRQQARQAAGVCRQGGQTTRSQRRPQPSAWQQPWPARLQTSPSSSSSSQEGWLPQRRRPH